MRTIEELIQSNPWKESIDTLELYSDKGQYYTPDFKQLVDFNNSKTANYQYQLNIPPCPWDGNPLRANVIFLTLNPGYVEYFNKTLAQLVASNSDLNKRVLEFRRKTLNLEADLRPEENRNEKPISTFDAVELLDDIYWTKKFKTLYKALPNLDIKQFRKRVSILQFIAYTSEQYSSMKELLPSQNFTKELIKFRLEHPDNGKRPLFVVMRAREQWKKLLGEDFINEYKDYFIYRMQYEINGVLQDPRGQFITPKSFADKKDWERIINAISAD